MADRSTIQCFSAYFIDFIPYGCCSHTQLQLSSRQPITHHRQQQHHPSGQFALIGSGGVVCQPPCSRAMNHARRSLMCICETIMQMCNLTMPMSPSKIPESKYGSTSSLC